MHKLNKKRQHCNGESLKMQCTTNVNEKVKIKYLGVLINLGVEELKHCIIGIASVVIVIAQVSYPNLRSLCTNAVCYKATTIKICK